MATSNEEALVKAANAINRHFSYLAPELLTRGELALIEAARWLSDLSWRSAEPAERYEPEEMQHALAVAQAILGVHPTQVTASDAGQADET